MPSNERDNRAREELQAGARVSSSGQASGDSDEKLPSGEAVGPYRILGVLGEGGMGVVYKAEDSRLQRIVALKFIKAGFSERLEREAKSISALNHPNVATLYDIGDHRGMPYLVLEFLQGRRLTGPLPLRVALDYGIKIAAALEAAHSHGIIHRDLKPSNIMVDDHGGVKVLDFGLAKLISLASPSPDESTASMSDITAEGHVAGTAPYMSPEQAEGKFLDSRTDIFSFGTVLYEMLSGRQAFKGQTAASVIAALLEREPKPIEGIPNELKHVVCRALRKDPARRWQHMGDVRLALEDVRAALEQPEADTSPRASHRLVFGLSILTALSAATAGYFAWRSAHATGTAGSFFFQQITDEPGQELNPSLSADGKSVVYARRIDGNWDICLLRVGGKNPVNLTRDSPADDTQPALSPDGDRIAFRSERDGGGLFVMGATGESVRRLADFCYLPAWSPDGKQIACSTVSPHRPDVRESLSSRIVVIDVDSGAQRVVNARTQDAVHPSWSPDGRRIVFWGMREGARDIFSVASTGGDVASLTNDDALDWDPIWSPDGKHVYFLSDRGGSMNLWRIPADPATGLSGGRPEPVMLPSSFAAGVSFSPDGKRAAYSSLQRSSNLFKVAFDVTREMAVGEPIPLTRGVKETFYPSISRDGAWIAFTLLGLQEDLARIRSDGSDFRRITEDSARDRVPRWSPDGKRLAFMSARSGRFEIWSIQPDGGSPTLLTEESPPGGVWYPAWAPDGVHLSYNLPDEMGYIMEVGKPWRDQQPRLARARLPEGSWLWLNDWSHDGGRIAGTLQRVEGGSMGVGYFDLKSKEFERLTDFGQLPRWLPDGKHMLFHAQGGLHLVDLETKRTKLVLPSKNGSVNPYFDVSWDGKMIVFSLETLEADIWLMSARE